MHPEEYTAAALASRQGLGSAVFPMGDGEEAVFHQDVLGATQRWFSQHGWPGGPYPIRIPQGLRGLVKSNTILCSIIGCFLNQSIGLRNSLSR